MADRLSYSEFRDQLLLAMAIAVEADTNKLMNPLDVASSVNGIFQPSWPSSAMSELSDSGMIAGMTFVSGGGKYRMTGRGLAKAEDFANSIGTDLYELIEEPRKSEANTDDVETGDLKAGFFLGESALSSIIPIDHLSDAFKELDRELRERIQELRSNNELMAEGGAEAQQHLAELEAGKLLINSEQADSGLVRRLLLPSLTWFAKKVRDESASALIKKLIALVTAFLSGGA